MGEEERWLEEGDIDELQAMLDPFPSVRMDSYVVSTSVNNPANEGPELVEPIGLIRSGSRSSDEYFGVLIQFGTSGSYILMKVMNPVFEIGDRLIRLTE